MPIADPQLLTIPPGLDLVLFRLLAYFRDHEDQDRRGDKNEGSSIFRPEGGLVGYNRTQGKAFTLPDTSFASTASQKDIFVFCMSRSLTDELREEFEAVVWALSSGLWHESWAWFREGPMLPRY